ncbi:hypothetical protein DRW03_09470 [Corallococcus sp. H22C18031201]|nr:hypothetical protein DRW03_09470 [Corallococcus sp. H22C18031201]
MLGRPSVGIHDNFFDLGGHSLLATQVVARIRSVLGREAPLGLLFDAPTVAKFAERLGDIAVTQAPPLKRVSRVGALPLSFAQQRLWFIDQLSPGSPLYNVPLPLRLEGDLDEKALLRGFEELVRRHESLRTTFRTESGEPVQDIHAKMAVPMAHVDLRHVADASQRQAEAVRLATEDARRPFDLAQGPLLRALLLKLQPREHLLLLTLHHIVSDGWSLGVLVREMSALYASFAQGRPSPLPELPVQYADYAVWQRTWLQGETLRTRLKWWAARLAGAPPALDLPTDRPRPAVFSNRGATLSVAFPRGVSEAVEALAQREGATPFMVLLAAFQSLLQRYSGQDDVLVGSPIANRRLAETEPLIGFFVNTLVLRARFTPDSSFRSLLAQVRDSTLGAFEHQDIPFERLVEELHPARDLGRTPLFQAMFALQNAPVPELALPGLALRPARLDDSGTTQFELSLDLRRAPEGFVGWLSFSTDLFEHTTAERLLTHLRVLLESVTTQPELPLRAVSLLAPEERETLLRNWTGPAAYLPRSGCFPQAFEQQVARTPDAPALRMGDVSLSFFELNTRANQLARHLRALGGGPESPVALCMERSPDALVALLAVLKSGGAFVPLDVSAPIPRRSLLLQACGATVLITQQAVFDAWQPQVPSVVCVDAEHERLSTLSGEDLPESAYPENLAYVIYTSGSTGTPKGVMVQHRSVSNLHRAMVRAACGALPSNARVSLNAPLHFDASIEHLVLWLEGHCLHIVPDDARKDPEQLLTWLEQHHIDALDCTPSQLKLLLQAGLLQRHHVPGILLVGGEAIDEASWLALQATPRTKAFNVYGPTECTVNSTLWPIQGTPVSVPVIGRPLSNTAALVLDSSGLPSPIGVPGELFLSGEGVARGYLHSPHLTAERFLPHPFSSTPGARLYRSGDKARWRPDGSLEFLGRLDFQIKLRGHRIELGEIEATLRAVPSVRDACVLLRQDSPGDSRLVAYLVPTSTPPTLDALRVHLRLHLPEYMVPSAFVFLGALPLSPNGKVDRREFPAPEWTDAQAATPHEPPRSGLEERLAESWRAVLRVAAVGRHDNFFELGGHSLLATQLMARLRSEMGIESGVRVLFEAPTLAQFAERLHDQAPGMRPPPLLRTPRTERIPLSFAQQRLWFLDQLEPGSPRYNIPAALRLSGRLDVPALQKAFDALRLRHEALRTTFHEEHGQPWQQIHAPVGLPLKVVNLIEIPEGQRQAEAIRIATQDARRPFSLSEGPLMRVTLMRVGTTEHVLLVNVHHSVSDGWSTGILVREVGMLYAAFTQGLPSPLPELPVQYADFARWQRDWLQGPALDAQLTWWKEELAGAPRALELPTDKVRPRGLSARGEALPVHLPVALASALESLAQREGATPFMVLLAAFQSLLQRYSGQDDVLVGSPIANRRLAETEPLIGFFVNTLVLRARFTPDSSFRSLLAQVRDSTLGAFEHQDIPFERLVEELHPARDLGRTPLFQAMFALQNAPAEEVALPELTMRGVDLEADTTLFELNLTLSRAPDGYRGVLTFSTDLFEVTTARRWMTHFERLLEGAVAAPTQPLRTLSLLSAEEQHGLMRECAGPEAYFPRTVCLPQAFEQQVARTPDAVAIVAEQETVSFLQLNARANQLARHLRGLGVGPEVPVAICLERSIAALAAILGILKAGGAYVPLDPSAPTQRTALLLRDSGAAVLVTRRRLLETWPLGDMHLVDLDTAGPEIAAQSPDDLTHHTTAENLAYVIYTSGSTGTPKGVMVQHRSVLHIHRALARSIYAGQPAGLRVAFNAPLYFDVSVDHLVQLLDGHSLHLVSEETRRDPERMLSWMEQGHVDVLGCTPAQAKLMLQAGLLTRAHVPRLLVLAGEAVDESLWRTLSATTRTRAFNGYGPTEATVLATTWLMQGTEVPVPVIGRPLSNSSAFVLDASGLPSPIGVPGELFLAGEGVARGYLRSPHLTAERFLPNPFSSVPGARLYRTGDKARWRPDGTLEYLGRLDFQIKLRGYRIELGEVEAALRALPAVRDACVLLRQDSPGDARLVAYLVPASTPPPLDVVRAHLRLHLPEYMVPSAFVVLEALPLSPNGKVDRRALPEPRTEERTTREQLAPRDPVEQQLARIWEDVLGTSALDVRDNFFDLGGHSLLAVTVMARIREAMGRRLPLAALFRAPTVEALATLLRDAHAEAHTSLVPFGDTAAGARPPLFFVHPVGGGVLCYAELARRLGPEQSFYGLQARGLDGTSEPRETLEALATAYVQAIQEVQPHGPYTLGGWSLGGVIAYEMARQLREHGEQIARIVLIDAYAPAPPHAAEPEPDALQRLGMFARDLMGLSLESLDLGAARRADLEPEALMNAIMEEAVKSGALPSGMGADSLRALYRVFEAHLRAARSYRARASPGPVLLLKATETPAGLPQDGGWSALVGAELEVHTVPGDHYSLLKAPAVEELARRLKEALEASR